MTSKTLLERINRINKITSLARLYHQQVGFPIAQGVLIQQIDAEVGDDAKLREATSHLLFKVGA